MAESIPEYAFETCGLTFKYLDACNSWLAHRTALDAFFVFGLKNGVDVDAGGVNVVGSELAEFDEFFDFGDDVIGGGGHHGIKVARGFAIDEIAPAVAFPRFDEREIAANAAFEDVLAAVKFARLLSFGDHRAVARRRIETGNAGAAGTDAFGESALRIKLELQPAAGDELLEKFIFADVGGNHFFDLALFKKNADAEAADSGV